MRWTTRSAWVMGITIAGTFLAGDAAAIDVGAENGTIGNLDYEIRLDEAAGGVEACFTASTESAAAGVGDATGVPSGDVGAPLETGAAELDLGSVSGTGNGTVCVTLVPPEAPALPEVPDTGSREPASAAVHLGIPTPEGVTEVDFGTFADPDQATVCAALSASGDGIEPESVEVCLPPSGDDAAGVPDAGADPLDSALPGGPAGLPIPEASLAQCLSEELPGLTSSEILERLPLLGGEGGATLPELPIPAGEGALPAGLPAR